MTTKHTPGPWEYVPSNEHHGPYVTAEFGPTICDCYTMSDPGIPSVRNGGTSYPIHHMREMADPNARLIAAAPDMLAALEAIAARVAGDFDNPALLSFGPLGDAADDIARIAQSAIAKVKGEA